MLTLYELHTTKGPHVHTMELEQLSDVGTDFYPIVRELGMKGRGWLEYRKPHRSNHRARNHRGRGASKNADGRKGPFSVYERSTI